MNKKNIICIFKVLENDKSLQNEVIKNFDDNLWWPSSINDPFLRLVIAGLSSRISYSMINTYREVIFRLSNIGYDNICKLSDVDLFEILHPLGLFKTRIGYIRSMINFISNYGHMFNSWKDDYFIEQIANKVSGASYKIGQCCVLYYRMYPNRIIPIDSGMKDILLPCLGFARVNGSYGHEKMRLELTELISVMTKEYLSITNLKFLNENNFYWWAHLSLIYYKRFYCNKKNTQNCIFHQNGIKVCHKCMII